jgi:hypothetical protein
MVIGEVVQSLQIDRRSLCDAIQISKRLIRAGLRGNLSLVLNAEFLNGRAIGGIFAVFKLVERAILAAGLAAKWSDVLPKLAGIDAARLRFLTAPIDEGLASLLSGRS